MKLGEHVILQPKAPAVLFTDLTIMSVITVKAFSSTDFCFNKIVLLSLIQTFSVVPIIQRPVQSFGQTAKRSKVQ